MIDFKKLMAEDKAAARYARVICRAQFISTTSQTNDIHGAAVFALIKQAYKDGRKSLKPANSQ